MIKFRWYYDKDSEETFLNEMSEKGYAMEKFFLGFYSFKPSQPGEYTYRVDLIEGKTKEENNAFYDLVREAGGEVVQTWGFWVFFRKKGKFELYTDRESQITKHQRIRKMYLWIGIFELLLAILQLMYFIDYGKLFYLIISIFMMMIFAAFMVQVFINTKKINQLTNV